MSRCRRRCVQSMVGDGQRHVERHAVVVRGERLQVGADLVADVAAARSCGRCRRCTRSTWPCCIRWPPALSAITVCGTPCWPSSQAVRLAPWLRGRVSSTQTWIGMPRVVRLVDRRQRRAPVDGREPAGVAVGQHVDALAVLLGRGDRRSAPAPCSPMRRLMATSSSADLGGARVRRARRAPAAAAARSSARMSSSAQRRLTAVGRVASSVW